MYKPVSKSNYKPRFFGYSTVTAVALILDGIVTFFVGPFGYHSNIYGDYCEWNLKKDMKRLRAKQEESKRKMHERVAERTRAEINKTHITEEV